MTRNMQSEYLQWAKKKAHFRFNLAGSGLVPYTLKDLAVDIVDLEISGSSFYGYAPLQEALAAKAAVKPQNVVAATGTSMANHLAMTAILKAGDEVLIEHPTYEPILAVIRYLDARPINFHRRFENGFRLDPEEIKKKLTPRTTLVVLTNLHNPSGVQIDREVLRGVGDLAKSAGARVLVDEVYLEALPDPASHYAFSLGDHFVTTSSLTKAYGLSGLRCGWIVAEPELAQKIWHLNDLFGSIPAHTAERLSVVALQKLDAISARSQQLLKTNRDLLRSFFYQHPELDVVMPDAGTIAFPRLEPGNCDDFCKLLAEKYETGVVPGRFFEMPGHFRIGIGGTTETVLEGLRRISAALQEWPAAAASR